MIDALCVDVSSPGCVCAAGQPDSAAVWREQPGDGPGTVFPSRLQVRTALPEDCVCVGLCG